MSMGYSEEEVVAHILEYKLLELGAGAVEVDEVNVKRLGVFMEFLKYR